ncbi:hypothetical protein, partial [Rhizobium leguminosarum]|uniref:hypothetical protein n=1 Tax=Rhizobium leguminosarum TaxID=384 RepID=UPI003F99D34C
ALNGFPFFPDFPLKSCGPKVRDDIHRVLAIALANISRVQRERLVQIRMDLRRSLQFYRR